jgi:hypothetical protein
MDAQASDVYERHALRFPMVNHLLFASYAARGIIANFIVDNKSIARTELEQKASTKCVSGRKLRQRLVGF